MITISGIGWIAKKKHGTLLKKFSGQYENAENLYSQLSEKKIFRWPVKNFERFDAASKIACCSAALALNDAGLSYAQEQKQNMGIFGTFNEGSARTNYAYFSDYIENGRKLARGNLFIYTLPSSPLAETSICFGFNGPLMYLLFEENGLIHLLTMAQAAIIGKECEKVMAIYRNEEDAVSFILENSVTAGKNPELENIIQKINNIIDIKEIISSI
ncbi:MAG: beta-ketoacyl synthase N-terminal-like domain-containing protein [Elusimicrobiota bacterium]